MLILRKGGRGDMIASGDHIPVPAMLQVVQQHGDERCRALTEDEWLRGGSEGREDLGVKRVR